EIYTKDNLPEMYVAAYPDQFAVWMTNGTVRELRFESDAMGYVFRNAIEIGDSLDDVLEKLGEPTQTITGGPMNNMTGNEGTLHKELNDRQGSSHYVLKDLGARMFFRNDMVGAIYLTGNQPVGSSSDDTAETETPEIF
ncbi:MAG: hypothetical protein JXA52_04020, partial [Planctomycetes bacterium]|nr:hypothetical protein [Planctomycetota bacterium]